MQNEFKKTKRKLQKKIAHPRNLNESKKKQNHRNFDPDPPLGSQSYSLPEFLVKFEADSIKNRFKVDF